ncbi:MAG: ribosomal L7Ae/L30e/S12e/Gadd45 family protein [Nanoarchaeota archaeon]|nr:ribosomal L7Ae/L30e/S12e/Gadd45 family protein [Nanoarchaeota archaeon]MBU4283587.1 ribosomal L7Ae/L30e/S12e/Gadd45 family protein [Nanoarchaeota archaeon]MBU4492948.1 ribosomal L7Ae/L30e/S12e/Gadd45 family protein [Nanoarchaeota archaeon]
MVKKQASTDIKKDLKTRKIIIGTRVVMKNLKLNMLEKIYIASNCSESSKKELEYYSKLLKIPVIKLKQPNDELGVICKKQYSISMLGVLKE